MCKVSVIIVSYNEKDYLPEAINSCLMQAYDDYEIIIGDDGSSDGSIELIEKYAAEYPDKIRFFIQDRKIGPEGVIPSVRVSNVLKRAFSMVRGKYILCLSGDDYIINKKRLKHQASFLDKNPRYVAISCKMLYKNGESYRGHDVKYPSSVLMFRSYGYQHVSTYMFRKEIVNSKYFLPCFFDDTGMSFSLLLSGKVRFEKIPMFVYRQRDDSIMHSSKKFEHDITELLLTQQLLGLKKKRIAFVAGVYSYWDRVFIERRELKKKKYRKYLLEAQKYPYNILSLAADYNSLKGWRKINADLFRYSVFLGHQLAEINKRIRAEERI